MDISTVFVDKEVEKIPTTIKGVVFFYYAYSMALNHASYHNGKPLNHAYMQGWVLYRQIFTSNHCS